MATIVTLEGLTVTVRFNFFELKQRLHVVLGEEVSLSQIARDSGLHRNTVERIYENKIDRVDLATLAKLLAFFHTKGMYIQLGELFTVLVEGN